MANTWVDKDDRELLEAIQGGNHDAFAALVRRHSEKFYRLVYRYVHERETAEDLVQDAFLKLWQEPSRWQPGRNVKFTTWFYRVLINLSLDWNKKRRPVALPEGTEIIDERETAEEAMIHNEQQRTLENAIAALPERQRTALTLCFDQGLSNREAADVMGLSLKTLQSLIMRAKTTLRERLRGTL